MMAGVQPLKEAFRLIPEYRDYVWGGGRLKPGVSPIAEAWVVYEKDRIEAGPYAGRTLGEAAAEQGTALLGKQTYQHTGLRFPLLIKLLDCAAWLSLQVHPNDQQAQQLEGAGQFGKTEAWYFLDAAPVAEMLCGLIPGTTPEALAKAIRTGKLLDLTQRIPVTKGDSIFISPGTIHALGPGLLVYEVQQTSDITYRVYDWDRPATPQRQLHIEKSIAVANPAAAAKSQPQPPLTDGSQHTLITCDYFTLEILASKSKTIQLDTREESFHALTVLDGQALVAGAGWQQTLGHFETALVPAACGSYTIQPLGDLTLLKASA
jgi:mannose-6-phosphate isomerase